MRHSLTFFLFLTFFGTLIADVSEDVYVTGSVIKKSSLLVANPITSFDIDDITGATLRALCKIDLSKIWVDIVVGADGIFSNTRSFFEKKKNEPKFKKAIAIRTIINSKSELSINEERISLFMGNNCNLVIYPINKNKELNLVCVISVKTDDPDNVKFLINKVVNQNPNFQKILNSNFKSWPLYSTPKILPLTGS